MSDSQHQAHSLSSRTLASGIGRSSRAGDINRDAMSLVPHWTPVDTDLLDNTRASVPTFPLDLLPSPWRDWISGTARATDAPVDYVAQAVLAAVAGMSGAGVWIRITSAWVEPLLLWLAVVGAPSTGKSPALASVRRLLTTLEREERGDDDEPARRIIVPEGTLGDITATLRDNQRGMLLWRDGISDCFAPLGGRRSARRLETFPVSILGSIDSDGLGQLLPRGEGGLAARFLYTWPHPPPFCPLGDRKRPRDDEVLILLRRLRQKAGTVGQPLALVLDEHGVASFNAFLARLHADVRQAEGLEAAWLGKGRGAVARLVGVLALLSWSATDATEPPRRVGREPVERAVSLWSDYYRPHARAFFQRAVPTDLECQARRVVRWLRANGPASLSREDVRRSALGQTVNASEADRVLARLVEAGVLRPLAGEERPKRGRPAMRWQVNPLLATA